MEQYTVTGMSCAACSARVEKAVKAVPGVTSCSVSLLTNSMGVEGTASASAIVKAVQEAGYGASPRAAAAETPSAELDALADHETPRLKKRLIASLVFLAVLMYFSMGHMMWGWPLPHWFDGNHVAMGLVQLLLAGIVMVINQKFFISGKGAHAPQHGHTGGAGFLGQLSLGTCPVRHDPRPGGRQRRLVMPHDGALL